MDPVGCTLFEPDFAINMKIRLRAIKPSNSHEISFLLVKIWPADSRITPDMFRTYMVPGLKRKGLLPR